MKAIEADYLVVGAGAMGMAFTDTVISESEATVVIVDRACQPGGHWTTAYPFVRLHQPSAYYGVNSRQLGSGTVDLTGLNAGYYELAGGAEVLAYFDAVMQQHLLPSGRVRYYPMSEYLGDGRVRTLNGAHMQITARRRVVDTTTKVASTVAPVLMALWVRYLVQTAVTWTVLGPSRGSRLFRTTRPVLQIIRRLLLLTCSAIAFFSLRVMQVGEFTAIVMLTPLVLTAVAALALREPVSSLRWLCLLGGFTGSLNVSVGDGPGQVVVGDFNHDSKPDLATANLVDHRTRLSLIAHRAHLHDVAAGSEHLVIQITISSAKEEQ